MNNDTFAEQIDVTTETGSVITVYVARAGGTLAGDHPAGSTQLAIEMGFEFDPFGGTLSVAGTVYTYTAAVVDGDPPPQFPAEDDETDLDDGWDTQTGEDVDLDDWDYAENDDRPTLLALTSPLDTGAADGDLVALEPESIVKVAQIQLADFDEPIEARVPHTLMDRLPEGSRGDNTEAETVAVRLDGTTWVIDDVMGKPPAIDPSALDPNGPQLPAPIIPGVDGEPDPDDPDHPEGSLTWTGSYYVERMRSGQLQADVAVANRLWVARYEDDTDPDSGPAENSAVIEQNPDDGFVVWSPQRDETTGDWIYERSDPDNPDSELVQVRERSVHFPAAEYEYDETAATWRRHAARFAGEVDADHLKVNGELEINSFGHLGPSSTLQLDNAVNDPRDTPTVTFGPKMRSWPSGRAFEEHGLEFDRQTETLVCGRAAPDPNGNFYNVRARYVYAHDGTLFRDTDNSFPFFRVAGFTTVNNRHYVLCRFLNYASPWTIVELGPETGALTGNNVNVTHLMADGLNNGCLGSAGRNDTVAFAYRDNRNRVGIRYYSLNLTNNPDVVGRDTDLVTSRPMCGVPDVGVVAAGDRVFHFDGPTHIPARSWSTGSGLIRGIARLPGTGYVTIHGDGTMAVHNDQITEPTRVYFSYTRSRTNVTPPRETRMSERLTVNWPVRKFATVQSPSPVAGTNDTNLYGGAGAGRTSQFRLTKTAGHAITTIDRVPTSGTNPPTASGFSAATETPARILSQAVIPNTSRPAVSLDASGAAELFGLAMAWVSRGSNSGQSIPNNSWTHIGWPVAVETHSDMPHSGGAFTVIQGGVYYVDAQCTITGFVNNTRFGMRLLLNGSAFLTIGNHATGSTFCTVQANRKIRVGAGSTLSVEVHQNSGSVQTLNADISQNTIDITRVHA